MRKKLLYFILVIAIALIFGGILQSFLLCRICLLIELYYCIAQGIKQKNFINPLLLFAITPFSLLIYVNISQSFMLTLTISTEILVIINILVFICAFEMTPSYANTQKCLGLGDDHNLILHAWLMLIIGLLPSVYRIIFGSIMPLASIISIFTVPAIVCVMKSKNKSHIIALILALVVSFVFYVTKFTILSTAMAVLISCEKYYVTTRKQRKWMIAAVIVAGIVMILSFTFANQGREHLGIQYYLKYYDVTWSGIDSLFMPYMYLTTPWANLQYVVQTQNTRTFGLWILKPLLGWLQIDEIFNQFYEMNSYSSFNTFTFIACNFKDFGYWGSVISSAFLGFYTKRIYSRFVLSKSPLDVACYAMVAQAVFEMFFSNEFYTMSFPFTIVALMGVYKKLFSSRNNVELEDIQV